MSAEHRNATEQARQLRADLQAAGLPTQTIVAAMSVEGINLFAVAYGRQEAAAWLRRIAAKLEAENDPLGTKH